MAEMQGMEAGMPSKRAHAFDAEEELVEKNLTEALQHMDKALAEHLEMLDVLQTRLEVVLRPSQPEINAVRRDDEKTPYDHRSDLQKKVDTQTETLREQSQQVRRLINRLDV